MRDSIEELQTESTLSDADKKKLDDTRKSLLDTLAPWIPGDFVVSYGALLTAWTAIRRSFGWLLIVAIASAIVFVFGAAFAATGFKTPSDRPFLRLSVRALVGGAVAVAAATAIPNSGWYDFKWFVDNELACVVTAGIGAGILVLILKGFTKLGWLP
jgi:hypothetical protein